MILYQATRRVIDRVTSENEQLLDPSVVYVRRELRNVDRSGIARNLADDQCLAEILERSVDCISEQMHLARLIRAYQHQTRAGFCHQIIRGLAEPLLIERRNACRQLLICNHRPETCVVRSCQNLPGKRVRKRRNLASRAPQTMVGHRAGEREAILDYVKPVHVIFWRPPSASRRECADRRDVALAAIEKIAVEREDHIGAIESRQHAYVVTEDALCGRTLSLAQERLVNAPAHARENLFQFCAQTFARGRMRFRDQKCNAVALLREERVTKLANIDVERCAIAPFPFVNESL